jgi:tetratricopeptide (TPR) repeat protein
MTRIYILALLTALLSATACSNLKAGSDVDSGRLAYLIGDNESALSYFQSAAQVDPNYVYGTALQQNVLTYVGRMEYATGRLQQARQTLEKALSTNTDPNMVRLYLGLTIARNGDREQGLKEIEGGMRGIHDWLDYINQAFRFSYGQFWDMRGEIRSSIQSDLAMLSGKDIDWERLIKDGEWLGKRLEEETDLARRSEREDQLRDTSNDSEP